jgi:cysteinyl-tRNA synthetase
MKPLILFNSLTQKKEKFVPLKGKLVTMYNCGPTVYERPHIGNFRAYIFADTLRRVLEFNGYQVKQIINITDVGHLTSDDDIGEDKIEKSAKEKKKSAWEIARYFEKLFKEDFKKLNLKKPFKFPRATEHIKEMIELIKILEKKGYTYKISDGIYFDTSKFRDYGKLGNLKKRKDLLSRIEVNPEKRNPFDFALWKFSPKNQKRQMEWKSPWGIGFPGWHIECSAMAMKYLGKIIDIHTGGIDHLTVHHPNEIAQSEATTGKKFVRYWLHVNFIFVEGQKMSKSLGNIFTLEDIEKRGFSPLAFKYLVLTSHYRSEINFTWQAMTSAENAYRNLIENVSGELIVDSNNIYPNKNRINYPNHNRIFGKNSGNPFGPHSGNTLNPRFAHKEILNIINNNLDTPKLIAKIWDVLRSNKSFEYKKNFVFLANKILGLGLEKFIKRKIPKEIKDKVLLREKLRKEKNWAIADKIREEILKFGYKIEDTDLGPIVKFAFK